MALLFIPRSGLRKPRFVTTPSLQHPDLDNIVSFWPFFEQGGTSTQDLITTREDTVNFGVNDRKWNEYFIQSPPTSSNKISVTLPALGTEYTWVSQAVITDPTRTKQYTAWTNNTYTFPAFIASTGGKIGYYDGTWQNLADAPTDGDVHTFAWVIKASTSVDIYMDGELLVSGGNSSSNAWIASTTSLFNRNTSGRQFAGQAYGVSVYDAAISAEQARAVTKNFWAPFERRIWVPVSAVTAPTGTGTITLGISTLASQAVMEPAGTGVLDLDDIILNASGTSVLEPTGSGVLSLDEAILLASGLQEIPGTAALTLSDIVLAASGVQDIPGTATVSLSEVLVDAQGAQEYIATAAPILSTTVLDADGNAAVAPDGTGTLVLDEITLAGEGVQTIPSDGAILLETTVLNASGFSGAPEGTGTLVLDQTALDAQAVMLPDGSAAIVLDLVVLAAQGLGPAPEVTGGPWIIYARRRGRR